MCSRATTDELIRQGAALRRAAHGCTRSVRSAVERTRRPSAFDLARAASRPFAMDSHVSTAQMNRAGAGLDAARQLRAPRVPADRRLTAAGPGAIDGARRRRVAVECTAGSLSQTIDLARSVGSAADATSTRVITADDVAGCSARTGNRTLAFTWAARDDARRVIAAHASALRRCAATGHASGGAASAERPTRRTAARDRVLSIGAQRVGIPDAARKRAHDQRGNHSQPARTTLGSIPGTRDTDHTRGSVCHVAESARWPTS